MGWTWALYLCSEGIESCISDAGLAMMKDRSPVPATWSQRGMGGACVGNVTAVAANPPGAAS
eukprot:5089800-Pyramimonas_sp.AAC.1